MTVGIPGARVAPEAPSAALPCCAGREGLEDFGFLIGPRWNGSAEARTSASSAAAPASRTRPTLAQDSFKGSFEGSFEGSLNGSHEASLNGSFNGSPAGSLEGSFNAVAGARGRPPESLRARGASLRSKAAIAAIPDHQKFHAKVGDRRWGKRDNASRRWCCF